MSTELNARKTRLKLGFELYRWLDVWFYSDPISFAQFGENKHPQPSPTMNNSHDRYLDELKTFFSDTHVCRDCFRLLVHFSIRLAAVGHAAQVLNMVEHSPEAALFTPLAGGLRLHLGQPDNTVGHAQQLAKEVATQIREATTEFSYDQTAVPAA